MTLRAHFWATQKVRWNALAFKTEEERRGWMIVNLDDCEGLIPSYRVIKIATNERGSAMQDELEPDNSTCSEEL